VGECERMSPHTPKWAFTLGIGVLRDSQIFKERFEGLKFIGLTKEEEDHDVDHYKKGLEIIAFKAKSSPQVEISQ
jgi:hypothetical protein